jgi:hypothetical protein
MLDFHVDLAAWIAGMEKWQDKDSENTNMIEW